MVVGDKKVMLPHIGIIIIIPSTTTLDRRAQREGQKELDPDQGDRTINLGGGTTPKRMNRKGEKHPTPNHP